MIKDKDRPNTPSDDDYRMRIKPFYNGQGHIAQKVKICVVLLHMKKGSQDFYEDLNIS